MGRVVISGRGAFGESGESLTPLDPQQILQLEHEKPKTKDEICTWYKTCIDRLFAAFPNIGEVYVMVENDQIYGEMLGSMTTEMFRGFRTVRYRFHGEGRGSKNQEWSQIVTHAHNKHKYSEVMTSLLAMSCLRLSDGLVSEDSRVLSVFKQQLESWRLIVKEDPNNPFAKQSIIATGKGPNTNDDLLCSLMQGLYHADRFSGHSITRLWSRECGWDWE